MTELDPYSIQAGRELDASIHHRILRQALSHSCPAYSSNADTAEYIKKIIESEYGSRIVTGTTETRVPTWFARYEIDPGNPTEVLAETYALAICRLALLWVMERR